MILTSKNDEKITALLINDTILVPDIEMSETLFSEFYGKPAGYDKPKPGESRGSLILDPLEALYLLEKDRIKIIDITSRKPLGKDKFSKWAAQRLPRFNILYPVYKNLRDRGFVVRSGLKYGSDFTVYRHGPGIDHSPYIVHCHESNHVIDPVEIVKAGRLSHSVRKTFILSITSKDEVLYLMFKWFKP